MIRSLPAKRFLSTGLLMVLASSLPIDALAKVKPAAPATKTNSAEAAKPKAPIHKEIKPILDTSARQSIESAAQKLPVETRKSLNQLSDSMHDEDRVIYNELRDEEELSMTDIGMLWEAAVERSATIRYAIEKLSRKDATGKPVEADNFSKRMLGSLVHLGGVAGSMWTGTPAGLIGSGMIQDMMTGNPQDSALSRVTDADMVLLAKNVETLQSQLIQTYYNYKHAKEKLTLAQEAQSTLNKYYDHAESLPTANATNEALKPLMQSMAESARQDVQNAQQAYSSSRSSLSLLVGTDAIAALEQSDAKKSRKSASAQ